MKNFFINSLFGGKAGGQIGDSGANANNTNAGQQVVWVIGDSLAQGSAIIPGTTPVLGTVKEYNGSYLVNITNSDTIGSVNGSPWPDYGIKWNQLTGMITVFNADGFSGAEFYPSVDNKNWYTSPGGILYDPSVVKTANACTEIGTTEPRVTLVMLGVNDAGPLTGITLSNIQIGMNSLFTRLESLYPNVPILIAEPGQKGSPATQPKLADIRRLLFNTDPAYMTVFTDDEVSFQPGLGCVQRYSNVYMGCDIIKSMVYDDDPNISEYESDYLHLNNRGNKLAGEEFAQFLYGNAI